MGRRNSSGAAADRDFHAVLRATRARTEQAVPDPAAVKSHAMALVGLGRPREALDVLSRVELDSEGHLLAARAAAAAGVDGAAQHLVSALQATPSLVGEALADPCLAPLFSAPEVLAWLSSLS